MNKLAIQSVEEWRKTQPSPSLTSIPDVIGSQGITTAGRAIIVVAVLIIIAILLFILYLLIKTIFPKTARYFGYLTWEFKKGREGKSV